MGALAQDVNRIRQSRKFGQRIMVNGDPGQENVQFAEFMRTVMDNSKYPSRLGIYYPADFMPRMAEKIEAEIEVQIQSYADRMKALNQNPLIVLYVNDTERSSTILEMARRYGVPVAGIVPLPLLQQLAHMHQADFIHVMCVPETSDHRHYLASGVRGHELVYVRFFSQDDSQYYVSAFNPTNYSSIRTIHPDPETGGAASNIVEIPSQISEAVPVPPAETMMRFEVGTQFTEKPNSPGIMTRYQRISGGKSTGSTDERELLVADKVTSLAEVETEPDPEIREDKRAYFLFYQNIQRTVYYRAIQILRLGQDLPPEMITELLASADIQAGVQNWITNTTGAAPSVRRSFLLGVLKGALVEFVFNLVKTELTRLGKRDLDAFVKRIVKEYKNRDVHVGRFLRYGAGQCRHMGMLLAAIFERLVVDENILDGNYYYKTAPGHGWMYYMTSTGTLYVLDGNQQNEVIVVDPNLKGFGSGRQVFIGRGEGEYGRGLYNYADFLPPYLREDSQGLLEALRAQMKVTLINSPVSPNTLIAGGISPRTAGNPDAVVEAMVIESNRQFLEYCSIFRSKYHIQILGNPAGNGYTVNGRDVPDREAALNEAMRLLVPDSIYVVYDRGGFWMIEKSDEDIAFYHHSAPFSDIGEALQYAKQYEFLLQSRIIRALACTGIHIVMDAAGYTGRSYSQNQILFEVATLKQAIAEAQRINSERQVQSGDGSPQGSGRPVIPVRAVPVSS
ncbi:MAG: hypothetical protein JW774_08495 [Candidatus Aureabacteria bacterium]|nr:hypothetical protein [Candidatus Auribacterota bacterium]